MFQISPLFFLHHRWQDIVVGAPQFFMKEGDIGGAVYVYINQAGKWDKITPIRLNGTKDSMFGLAVENISDINQDSYQGGNLASVLISDISVLVS